MARIVKICDDDLTIDSCLTGGYQLPRSKLVKAKVSFRSISLSKLYMYRKIDHSLSSSMFPFIEFELISYFSVFFNL